MVYGSSRSLDAGLSKAFVEVRAGWIGAVDGVFLPYLAEAAREGVAVAFHSKEENNPTS